MRQRGGSQVTVEAEDAVTHLQAMDLQPPPEASGVSPSWPQKEPHPHPQYRDLGFWLPDLWRGKIRCFQAPGLSSFVRAALGPHSLPGSRGLPPISTPTSSSSSPRSLAQRLPPGMRLTCL